MAKSNGSGRWNTMVLTVGILTWSGCEGMISISDTQVGSYTLVTDSQQALRLNQCTKAKGADGNCTAYPNPKECSALKLTLLSSGKILTECTIAREKGGSAVEPSQNPGLPILCRAAKGNACQQCVDVYGVRVIDSCKAGAGDLFATGESAPTSTGCTPADTVTQYAKEVNQILAANRVNFSFSPDLNQAIKDAARALPKGMEDRPCTEALLEGVRYDLFPRFAELCKDGQGGKKICRCGAVANLAMRAVCNKLRAQCGTGQWEMALWSAMGATSRALSKAKYSQEKWAADPDDTRPLPGSGNGNENGSGNGGNSGSGNQGGDAGGNGSGGTDGSGGNNSSTGSQPGDTPNSSSGNGTGGNGTGGNGGTGNTGNNGTTGGGTNTANGGNGGNTTTGNQGGDTGIGGTTPSSDGTGGNGTGGTGGTSGAGGNGASGGSTGIGAGGNNPAGSQPQDTPGTTSGITGGGAGPNNTGAGGSCGSAGSNGTTGAGGSCGSGGNSGAGSQPNDCGGTGAGGAGGSCGSSIGTPGSGTPGSGCSGGSTASNPGSGCQPGTPSDNNSGGTPPTDIQCVGSPLILDLADDGFELTSQEEGIQFDLLGQGVVSTAWVKSQDDALLGLDRNGNGRIDGGDELFGESHGLDKRTTADGFQALALVDEKRHGGNRDGRIDADDQLFGKLLLWNDRNRDGVSQPQELRTLRQAGVQELLLTSTSHPNDSDRHGNQLALQGLFRRSNGTLGTMIDVFLLFGEALVPLVAGR